MAKDREKMVTTDPDLIRMSKKHKRPGFGQYILFFFLLRDEQKDLQVY